MTTDRLRAAIVGATGYTGAELLRLLSVHPKVQVTCVTSRQAAGQRVDAWFPHLRGFCELEFQAVTPADLPDVDVVFFATPHGTAMHHAAALLERGIRVIDLSADFRLRDAAEFERWYGQPHAAPELLEHAVYGLPEVNADALAGAELIAGPGCYPTAVQLGMLPLLEAGAVEPHSLIADCKSGVSGAGRSASVANLMAEVGESFKAYAAGGHRHRPEIEQGLRLAGGPATSLVFVPHLVPMIRGIHATLYARAPGTQSGQQDWQALYEQRYASAPFVQVLPPGSHPETRAVRGANHCQIAVHEVDAGHGTRMVVVLSVIDNLVKGAAGQTVQAMNLAFGLDESAGLRTPGLLP